MSSFKRLVSGALFGGALLTVGSMVVSSDAVAQAAAKWAVSCDGNYCCTVNQDSGAVGQCWNK